MRHKLEDLTMRAGERLMELYEQLPSLDVHKKEDGSPVTKADFLSHQTIIAGLAQFSNLPVVSEEGEAFPRPLGFDRYWLIDPLDGTKEYLRKSDAFTVNIALIDRGLPIAGVVYAPALDELYSAFDGEAYFNHQPLMRVPKSEGQSLRVLTSSLHPSADLDRFLQENRLSDIEALGSSLKFGRLARGDADLYPRLGPTSEWDTAAGQAVAEAAGCVVWDIDSNNRLRYSKQDVLNPWFLAYHPEHLPNLTWQGKPVIKKVN